MSYESVDNVRRQAYIAETQNLKPISVHKEPGWWTEDYVIDRELIRFAGMTEGEWIWRTNMSHEENITRPN